MSNKELESCLEGIPLQDMGYLEDDVKEIAFKAFGVWIFGQTCAIDPKTNKLVYYPHDVERWLKMCPGLGKGVDD